MYIGSLITEDGRSEKRDQESQETNTDSTDHNHQHDNTNSYYRVEAYTWRPD